MKQPQSLRTKKTGWLRWWTHNRQASRQSKRPRRPKTRFVADVVPVAVEAEAVRADALFPVVAEPRQRAGLLTNVAFRVPAAGAEREELHQLTRVVLVRRPLGVVRPREPEQHRRIAGDGQQQVVEPPQPVPAESAFWRSISPCEPTPSFDVANQSCQTSVMRSINGRLPRTMRSSHQRWSWPHASRGASGRPFSSFGRGPTKRWCPGAVSARTDSFRPCLASFFAWPRRGPKPARQSRRSACSGPNSPR